MARPYYVYGGNLLNREKYTSVVKTAYGNRRYFSSIDTDVYFGNVLIDEMVAFDFMIDEKKIPIYGYNNFTPKRIVTGQKTIQGSFAINFTQSLNLKLIIDSLDDSIYYNKYEDTQFFCGDDNQALFGKSFDITLSYGEHLSEGSHNSCSQTLVGCSITSYRQAFDTSGEPILDMYTFIAKDLMLNVDLSMEEIKVGGNFITNNDTKVEQESDEDVKVANINVEGQVDMLIEYCKNHEDTLGLQINPEFNYVNGMPQISLGIEPYNNVELTTSDIVINITDIALPGSHNFNLNSKLDNNNFYYDMTSHINVGKDIYSLFVKDKMEYLECEISMTCNEKSVNEKTFLFPGNIEVTTTGGGNKKPVTPEPTPAPSPDQDMNLVLIDNNILKMTITGTYEDKWINDEGQTRGEVGYRFEVENKTSNPIMVGTESISCNGIMQDDNSIFAWTIQPGKKDLGDGYFFIGNNEVKGLESLKDVLINFFVSDEITGEWIYEFEANIK
jgi:hypothetical protein